MGNNNKHIIVSNRLRFEDAADQELARQIQEATGLDTNNAVKLIFRRYGPAFLAWWHSPHGVGTPVPSLPHQSPVAPPTQGSATVAAVEEVEVTPQPKRQLDPGHHLEPMSNLLGQLDDMFK